MSEVEQARIKLSEVDIKFAEFHDSVLRIKGLTEYQKQDIWTYIYNIDINIGKLILYLEELEQ